MATIKERLKVLENEFKHFIRDQRGLLPVGSGGGSRFVKKAGDTMNGNLKFDCNFGIDGESSVGIFRQAFLTTSNHIFVWGHQDITNRICGVTWEPGTAAGSQRDNAMNLGSSGARFNDLFVGKVILSNVALDGSPVEGMLQYNSATNKINFYNGSAWEVVTSA